MDLVLAGKLVVSEMEKHHLFSIGWAFGWDKAKVCFGRCNYTKKRITMSRALTLANNETEFLDTLRHEIAHALVGTGHAHDSQWELMAVRVGAKPEACYDSAHVKAVESPYTGTCQDCGIVVPRYKVPRPGMLRTGYHPKCQHKANGGKLVWRMRGVLMIAPPKLELPTPMWQTQVAAHLAPREFVNQDVAQPDINSMWERLKKLEEKL